MERIARAEIAEIAEVAAETSEGTEKSVEMQAALKMSALKLSARMQAGRDKETALLRQRMEALEAELAHSAGAASHFATLSKELRRQVERTKAAEAPGFLKDVVFKYLVAPPEQQETIFKLLSSILQFSSVEVAHIQKAKDHEHSTTTATGILSSFFLAPAPPEQDSFADPAAVVEGEGDTSSVGGAEPEALPGYELYTGRSSGGSAGGYVGNMSATSYDPDAWIHAAPSSRLRPQSGPPLSVSATPLCTPFSADSEPAGGESAGDAATQAALAEYKKKVARLKRLLLAANTHIETFKSDLSASKQLITVRDETIRGLEQKGGGGTR